MQLKEFLLYSFLIYFIGFLFSLRMVTFIKKRFLKLKIPAIKIRAAIKKYGDYTFIATSFLMLLVAYLFLSGLTSGGKLVFSTADVIQLLIVITTLLVLMHSILIGDRYSLKREQPILDLEFNFSEPDCHKTFNNITLDTSSGRLFFQINTYYIRCRVKNIGKSTLKNASVIIEKVETNGITLSNFVPLNLTWALTEIQANRGVVEIPQGVFRTIDLISISKPSDITPITNLLVANSNDPTFRRFSMLQHGISICSPIQPNTMSDILPSGDYLFYISVASDSLPPMYAKFKVDYDGGWEDNFLQMVPAHLKVRLIKYGESKKEVFGE